MKRTLYVLYVAPSTEKRNCQISCKADVKIRSFKAIVTFLLSRLFFVLHPKALWMYDCMTSSYRSNAQHKNLNLCFRGCPSKCRSLLWSELGRYQETPTVFSNYAVTFLIKNLTNSICSSRKACCSFKDAVLDIHYNPQFSWKQTDLHV